MRDELLTTSNRHFWRVGTLSMPGGAKMTIQETVEFWVTELADAGIIEFVWNREEGAFERKEE